MTQSPPITFGAALKWARYRWLARRRHPHRSPLKQVGIYKADRLGDFALAVSAIRLIVDHEGADRCLLIIASPAEELAAREFPDVERVTVNPWPNSITRYMREARRTPLFTRGVTRLICLRHFLALSECAIVGAIPATETWGSPNASLAREPGHWLGYVPFDHMCRRYEQKDAEPWELVRHRAVVGTYLGMHVAPNKILPRIQPRLGVPDGPRSVAISPFGSNPIRDLPFPLLVAAARHLRKCHGLHVRLLAPRQDSDRYRTLASDLDRAGAGHVDVEVCGTTNSLIDALAKSTLVLSTETATAHLASALDLPMVAIIGGGHFGWFAPWARTHRQRWLTNEVPCRLCNWICNQPEPLCITGISSSTILQSIDSLLSQNSAPDEITSEFT